VADEEDLKERVKEVLNEKDADGAVELLTADDAYNISKGERNRLAALAIKGAYIAPYYSRVVGLLSGDVVKSLSEDLGKHGKPAAVFEVLEDPYHRKQHTAILLGAIANENIRTARLYAATINSVSNEMKDTLNTALGRDVHVSNEELASILGDPKFAAHRKAIIENVWARMNADELEKLGEELRPIFSDEEAAQWDGAVAHKRKSEAEHGTHEASSDETSDFTWAMIIIGALILIGFAASYS
jgi:hypothetical protein